MKKSPIYFGIITALASVSVSVNAESLQIKHALGTTTLEQTPQRVVALGVGPLDALDAFGINPVGVTKFPSTPEYLKKYAGNEYPSAGSLFEPDFEKIYAEKPDLILIGPRNSKNYGELSKIAPTIVYTLDSNKSLWEGTKEEWRMLGKIFNITDKVDQQISALDKDFKSIHDYNVAHPMKAMTVMAMGGKMAAFGADSRFGSIYRDFGFQEAYHAEKPKTQGKPENAAKSGDKGQTQNGPKGRHGNLVSFEFIQEKNPDIIFVIDKDQLTNHGKSETKSNFNNALINETNAAKNHKISYLDVNAWYVSIGGVHSTKQMIEDMKEAIK